MTLQEKFAALTPEQAEKLQEVKTAQQLDAFLAENKLDATDEEKQAALKYVETGLLPLDDEELENVAGGLCKDDKGRYVVTLLTKCQYGLKGVYYRTPLHPGESSEVTRRRTCGDGGTGTSRSNGWCEHCTCEKVVRYCNYPKKFS